MQEKEQKWVEGLRRQDPNALVQVIEAYTDYVAAVINGRSGGQLTAQDVEEAVADVFVSLWKHATKLRSDAPLKPWLAQVARNAALKKLRNHSGEPLPLEEDNFVLEEPDVVQKAERTEQARQVRYAIDTLGEPDRTVFLRHYYYYQTVEQISQIMNINLSTVKSKLARGRIALRKVLEQEENQYAS